MNPAPMPVIAAFYAGLIGLLLLVLAIPVSRLRHSPEVGLGDGGNARLARAMLAHANTVEWALPTKIILMISELTLSKKIILHACGIALVAGRVLHAVGISSTGGSSFGRLVGTSLTWAALAFLALWDIWAFVRLALI